jgi:hypothetical protein
VVLHPDVPQVAELAVVTFPFRASRASGSVVERWVALLRRPLCQFTSGLRPVGGTDPPCSSSSSRDVKLLIAPRPRAGRRRR